MCPIAQRTERKSVRVIFFIHCLVSGDYVELREDLFYLHFLFSLSKTCLLICKLLSCPFIELFPPRKMCSNSNQQQSTFIEETHKHYFSSFSWGWIVLF